MFNHLYKAVDVEENFGLDFSALGPGPGGRTLAGAPLAGQGEGEGAASLTVTPLAGQAEGELSRGGVHLVGDDDAGN